MNTYTPGQKVTIRIDSDAEISDYLRESVSGLVFEGVYERRALVLQGEYPHRVAYTDKSGHWDAYLFSDSEVSAA